MPALAAAEAAQDAPALRRGRTAAVAWAVVAVLALAVGWRVLAPPALGGTATLVSVDGTSMLPRFHGSDLVVLRRAGRYRVGDVTGYRSRLLGRIVMHRIVRIEHGRYVFKGDNNSFLDPERPTRSQLVGRLWLRVPALGRVVGAFEQPAVPAAVAAVLVVAFGFSGRRR